MPRPLIAGTITLRLIVWIGTVLIAPFVINKLSKEKEIGREIDYFESLVLSLLLFSIAFTPYLFYRVFIIIFRPRYFRLLSFVWLIGGTFLNAAVINLYKRIEYWKALALWILTLIVSFTAGFVLSSFSVFLLRSLR